MCVDDLDFVVEEFTPVSLYLAVLPTLFQLFLAQFLSDCTSFLFQLLHEAREVETKMKVLNIISLLMERVGSAIQPHVPTLLQTLPSLWEESGQQNCSMLRSIIITTLTNITKSLGTASVGLHDFILPVIQLATNVKLVGVT